jgi:hypothetical protein
VSMNSSPTVRTTAKVRHVGEVEGELDDLIECQPRRGTPVTADFVISAYDGLSGMAALAVSRWIEAQTGWSTRKFVRTARRHGVIEIQAGGHCITAADPAAQRPAEGSNKISNASQDGH